jgi:hypothetical protein
MPTAARMPNLPRPTGRERTAGDYAPSVSSPQEAGRAPSRSAASGTDDWPSQATDTIVRVVGAVRDKTTANIEKGARWVVFGLVVAVAAIAGFVVLILAAVRALTILVDRAWIAHLIIGAVFTAGGLVLMRLARRRPAEA